MPRGDKSKYTDEQDRKAEHSAERYEQHGVPDAEAERRAWATVNKDDGGGKAGGSGTGRHTGHPASQHGGEASAAIPKADRSEAARKAATTRRRNAEQAGNS